MNNLRDALLKAGLVTGEAAARAMAAAPRMRDTTSTATGKTRRRWTAEVAKPEILKNPASATSRRLISEAHEKFDDGSEEFKRWLRSLYELRDQLDRLDHADREQLICRAFRKSGKRFDVGHRDEE